MKDQSAIRYLLVILIVLLLLSCNLIPNPATLPSSKPTGAAGSGQPNAGSAEVGQSTGDGNFQVQPLSTLPAGLPPWQPELNAIKTQTLTPGQEQTVELPGQLALDVPAGVIDGPLPDLVISAITNKIPPLLPGQEVLQIFDISLGEVHQLAKPITVTMNYDPGRLNPSLPASAQLTAILRDNASDTWVSVPYDIDETANTVSFTTDHLSIIGLYLQAKVDHSCITPHFQIAYNDANIASEAENMHLIYQPTQNLCGSVNAPVFIQAVAEFLEAAYAGYEAEGFSFPQRGIQVLPANIPDSYLLSADSQYDTLTGSLVISTSTWGNPILLRHDCAHELFHYWQYNNLKSMWWYLGNQWWMDATADYAADKVAWTGTSFGPTNSMGKYIRPTFLRYGLEATSDYHAYSASRFVEYLLGESYAYPTFYDLWMDTDDTADALVSLQNSVQNRMGETLGEVYLDFANYMLFDKSSKLPLQSGVYGSAAMTTHDIYLPQDGEQTIEIYDQPSYASDLAGITVQEPYFMSLEWVDSSGGSVYVLFDNDSDQRNGTLKATRLYPDTPAIFPMFPEQVAYVLMINDSLSSSMDYMINVNVSKVEIYTLDLGFTSESSKCTDNISFGVPTVFMNVKDDKAVIHYDSAVDDMWWSELSEHTATASGDGVVYNGRISGNITLEDKVLMGSRDAKGKPVYGNIQIQATFSLIPVPEAPFAWNGEAQGSASVVLPANGDFAGFSCSGTVNKIYAFPAYYFPKPK